MDGVEPMQLWGAGGKIGHVAVFHRDVDGTAYILESTDGNCRPTSGIQKNLFNDWIQDIKNCQFNAIVVKLADKIS